MRKIIMIAAIAVAAVSAASCGKIKNIMGKEDKAVTDSTALEWKSVNPEELKIKPIGLIANDWLALSVGDKNASNAMTISWGGIGELWGKPVFTVYVSSDRASKKMMDKYDWFTVTAFPDSPVLKDALVYIGSHSYADEKDKVTNAGLSFEFTQHSNPLISEGNLAIECKKIYSNEFEYDKIPEDVKEKFYSRMGLHTMYIGEIVNVWTKGMTLAEEQLDSLSEQPTIQ